MRWPAILIAPFLLGGTTIVGPPSFTIGDAVADENSGQLCFPVKKHGKLNKLSSTVTFYQIAGTAKPTDDYVFVQTTISFAYRETLKQACVPLINDDVPEPTETLTGKIIAGTNARLYDGTAAGQITDTDTASIPSADGWYAFPLTEPYHGLNKATYARALSACNPVQPTWGPQLVAGAIYVITGWGVHGFTADGPRYDHWSVVKEGAGPVTATNQSTVATECLVGVYKVKPEFPWVTP